MNHPSCSWKLEPRSARSFAMFSLAWCSWFLRFDISLCARVSSFFSLANCRSKPSDLSVRPLRLPNGTLLQVSAWASIARSWRMPSSNKRPTGAPLILQNFSRHVVNTFLRFNLVTASPGDGSKSRERVNPIAFCVAVFSLVPYSRIWKRQNFLAISSWCVPIGSNLLNSHS